MSFSVKTQGYATSAPYQNGSNKRQAVIIEGEKTLSSVSREARSPSSNSNQTTQSPRPDTIDQSLGVKRILEAKPVVDHSPLFGSTHIAAARSPLMAFAAATQVSARLGSSIDTYV
jgi:hypothetical protein